jgi:hypothetical protein
MEDENNLGDIMYERANKMGWDSVETEIKSQVPQGQIF